ncbi:MAG: hypothetical protein QOC78_285 [Solirubrobacteraceae bacterium]|jgi:hypothetical protein|nr:hypothetical protein [Solirubrobacteraceae bacterium]
MRRVPLRRTTRLRRHGLARRTELARGGSLERSALAPASPAQRAKVAGQRCVVCGAASRCDPAHLVPRSLGGCPSAECVVALCRAHHRAYDLGELDLLPHVEPALRREVAHAVMHLGLIGALRRLTGRRTVGEE